MFSKQRGLHLVLLSDYLLLDSFMTKRSACTEVLITSIRATMPGSMANLKASLQGYFSCTPRGISIAKAPLQTCKEDVSHAGSPSGGCPQSAFRAYLGGLLEKQSEMTGVKESAET